MKTNKSLDYIFMTSNSFLYLYIENFLFIKFVEKITKKKKPSQKLINLL